MYVCHAEMNAVLNKNSSTVEDCRIYVALFPCNECAKIIIQSGIKEVGPHKGNLCTPPGPNSALIFWQVIYFSDKNADKPETVASKKLFTMSGVAFRQFTPKSNSIVIDFDAINQ
jgi:dCMP deaminase